MNTAYNSRRFFNQSPLRSRFFNANRRKYNPLTIDEPRILQLSEKYNMLPKSIAYIRAAIKNGGWSKNALIEHIKNENIRRLQAIEEYKVDNMYSEAQKLDLIRRTSENLIFRRGIMDILTRLTPLELRDLLY